MIGTLTARPSIILHTDAPVPGLAVLSETHPDLEVHACTSYGGLAEAVARVGAEVVYSVRFAGSAGFPREALVENATVKWVSVGGSGTDHLQPWDPNAVTVTNAAGVAADMVAEYVLGAMLSFSLGLRGFARRQQAREWRSAKVEPIEGRTVLIIGLGKTGEAVARRAAAMGMRALGVRAWPKPTPFVEEVFGVDELPALWARADFVVCCVPLLGATRSLIGTRAFAAMKPNAVLIDVSRGGVVDQDALLAALERGSLKGAALDVFATEPLPPDNPLWTYENVIVTPHCSSIYEGWDVKAVRMFAENLALYRSGKRLQNVVDPVRGY